MIARPFAGEPGAWVRTAGRKDFSLPPPGPTLLDRLAERHVPRVGVGKVDDLFAGPGHHQHPHRDQRRGLRA